MDKVHNTELRSEKIRHIIGRIPPLLVRSGIGVVSAVFFLLILAACYIPYPETIQVPVRVGHVTTGGGTAVALIPYSRITEIKSGMKVEIQFEGYSATTYGFTEGLVTHIDKAVVTKGDGDYFTAVASFSQPSGYTVMDKQKGTASVYLSDVSLAEKIVRMNLPGGQSR